MPSVLEACTRIPIVLQCRAIVDYGIRAASESSVTAALVGERGYVFIETFTCRKPLKSASGSFDRPRVTCD
jgi:hypothetical protein